MGKKMLRLFLTIVLILGITTNVSFAAESVQAAEFFDSESDRKVKTLNEVSSVYVNISFTAKASGDARVLAALYDDEENFKKAYILGTLTMTEGETAEYETPDIETDGADMLKVFVWNSQDTIEPIIPAASISKGEEPVEPSPVDKFVNTGITEVDANGAAIPLGELFAAVDGASIDSSAVEVTVSGVAADVVYNTDDWTQGTVKFCGTGTAGVTITDNDYCNPTSIELTVNAVDKFAAKFKNTGKYLYRVGNKNAVTLDSLFEALDGGAINSPAVSVTVESVEGGVTYEYKPNTSDWKAGTIKFAKDGVVSVTIRESLNNPLTLYFEVVNAENITAAKSSTGTNIVLLNDINISAGGAVNYTNCTVYGNGFTYNVRGGMNMYNAKQGHGIIIVKQATLDNLVIVGDVYDTYGAYTTQEDYTSAIDAENSVIQNCYVANCSAPIRANGVSVKNTTLYGGTVANLIISGGTNTLEDVTTVNYNDGRGVLGFGIVISDGANENVKLVLDGELKQYNFVCADDSASVPDDYAKKLINAMFDSAYSAYHLGTDTKYVNTGIISMVSTFDESDITNNTGNGYTGTTVSYNTGFATATGYLYSLPAAGNSVDNGYATENDAHKATVQGDYLPTFKFELGEQAISNEGADDTRYLEGDKSGVEALYMSNEEPITLDLTKLATAYKYDGISCAVTASYKDLNGNILGTDTVVSLTSSGSLVFTVTDNIFYGKDGSLLDRSVERIYEVPIIVNQKAPEVKNAEITIKTTSLTGTYTAAGTFDTSQYLSFKPLDAITVTDYDASGNGTTVDLTANISTTTVDYANTTKGAWGGATITITYTDGRVLTIVLGSTSINSPGASNGGKTITVTNGTVKSDGKVAKSSATGGTWPITSYTFKGNSGSTVSPAESKTVNVTFSDSSSGGGCVTGDTLVTLADGSSKRIDSLTHEDVLKVWDFEKGEYTTAPIAVIRNHGLEANTIITLRFSDGTVTKVVNEHGYYDKDLKKFVAVNEKTAKEYIGHSFAKEAGNAYETVTLEDVVVETGYTEAWSLLTAHHYNFVTDGIFSISSSVRGLEYFMPFEYGDDMKLDEEKKQADIEKYGLYTYEDFEGILTPEQFDALNMPQIKVSVGKGIITWEDLMYIIEKEVLSSEGI